MHSNDAMTLMRHAGIDVRAGTPADLELVLPTGERVIVELKTYHRAPRLSALTAASQRSGRQVLAVIPRAPGSLENAAKTGMIDLISVDEGIVILGGEEWARGEAAKESIDSRPAWGRWSIMRTLAQLDYPVRQHQLASLAGTSQVTVSKTLSSLAGVARTDEGYEAIDRNEMLRAWFDEYPGAGGVHMSWYGLDAPTVQAAKLVQLAAELRVPCLATGDAAAAAVAPWRRIGAVHYYTPELLDLTVIGLTPVSASDEKTLIITIPSDPTVMRTHQTQYGIEMVDFLIAYWDLAHADGADAAEAAEVLLSKVFGK